MGQQGLLPGRIFILLMTLLPLVSWGGVRQDSRAADEAALRALVDRYFETHTIGSVTDYSALWSETSPDLQLRSQALERVLAASRLSYTTPRVSRLNIDGNRAVLWVTTRRSATRVRESTSITVSTMALSLEFVREASGWKLWKEASAVAELTRELVAAQTEEERARLIALDRELLTRDLLFLLGGQSERYYASGEYPRALIIQRLMLRVAEIIESPADQITAWRTLGNLHYLLKDFDSAINSYQRSIALIGDSDRKFDLAALWTGLGLSYAAKGRRTLAIEAYQKSLVFSREVGDNGGAANSLDAIALLKREEGLYAEAGEAYRQVLGLREAHRDRQAVSATLINLAEVEYEQGEDDRALAYYHQALSIIQGIGRPANLVHVLHNIANLYYLQGNYDLALTNYQLEREAADATASLPGAAAALAGIGLVQTLFGDYSASLDAYRLCLAIWQQLKNTEEEANVLQKIGRVYLAQGEPQKALKEFREAVALREQLQDRREVGWALLDMGSALAVLREFPEAVATDERSLSLFEALDDRSGTGAALVHLAGIHFVQEDYARTIALAGRAAAIAREAGDTDILWQARHRQGRAHYRLKQAALSRQAFTDAIAAIESRQQNAGESRPQRILDDRLAPYLGMVDLAVHGNLHAEAFGYSERARGRTLKLLMQAQHLRITRSMTRAEQATEQKLMKDRAVLTSQISREREHKSPQPARLAALSARLRTVQRESEAFEQRLYRLRPDVRVLRGEGSPITTARVGPLLPSRSSAILEFVETDEEIYLFVFTRGSADSRPAKLQTYALGVSRRELAERMVYFQDMLARKQDGWERLARQLYDLLFKPAEEQLKEKTELLIIPDGWLWNLPFGALQPTQGTFLIERYALSIAPSLTAFQRMRANRLNRNNPGNQRAALDVVAFGNPTLNPSVIERMRAALRSERPKMLVQTGSEGLRIGEIYGRQHSRVLLGTDARVDRVASDAAGARVLHLAVPVALSEASPLYSPVAFASVNDGSSADGTAQLRDMLSWNIKSELVVLSASEVVPRGQSIGRAMTGFSWTMVVAGSPAALASQWWVQGEPTSDIMSAFHRERRVSQRSAIAWQKAVRERLERAEYRHPFYWAGFVLLGDSY